MRYQKKTKTKIKAAPGGEDLCRAIESVYKQIQTVDDNTDQRLINFWQRTTDLIGILEARIGFLNERIALIENLPKDVTKTRKREKAKNKGSV